MSTLDALTVTDQTNGTEYPVIFAGLEWIIETFEGVQIVIRLSSVRSLAFMLGVAILAGLVETSAMPGPVGHRPWPHGHPDGHDPLLYQGLRLKPPFLLARHPRSCRPRRDVRRCFVKWAEPL